MSKRSTEPPSPDAGFTLIEVTIVLVVMGTLMAALSLAVSVALRSAPSSEDRIDDSRTTRSLSTWLAQDTTSTPPVEPAGAFGGLDTSPTGASDPAGSNDCGGEGQNIVHLTWAETVTGTTTFVSNYRFVNTATGARVARYTCSQTGTDPFTSPRTQMLTPTLDAAAPPVANFDAASNLLSFTLTGLSGETVLIETSSRNPSDFFP